MPNSQLKVVVSTLFSFFSKPLLCAIFYRYVEATFFIDM
jgi:hypothetical protein